MLLRKSFFVFIVVFAFAGIATDVYANQRVALVIGNSAYQHTAQLGNPKNDATDIAAVLKQLGFQVIDGFDLDKVAFERKVRDFSAALRAAEVGLFFYAGHGLQVAGQNYLVPVDAKAETADALDWEMVRLDLVQRTMERAASTNIIFLDACRNNPLARNLARAMGTRSADIGGGLAPVESGIGTLISFSTQPGNVALDGKGRNSPYAGALVKRMAMSNDDLSGLLIDVRNDVRKETQNAQVPWEHSALTGRFYFNPATRPAPSAGPAPQANETDRQLRARSAALVERGRTYARNRDIDSAIADYSEAIRLIPTNAPAFNSRGFAYEIKRDYDRAIADYSEAIRLDPKYGLAITNRGILYGKKGDHDRAIADLSEAIRLDPKHAYALSNRGNAYRDKGEYDRAIADYNEAIRLDPKDASTFTNRGVAYSGKREYDRAIADSTEAIQLAPQYAPGYCNRGRAKQAKGDRRGGSEDINRANQLSPSSCR